MYNRIDRTTSIGEYGPYGQAARVYGAAGSFGVKQEMDRNQEQSKTVQPDTWIIKNNAMSKKE